MGVYRSAGDSERSAQFFHGHLAAAHCHPVHADTVLSLRHPVLLGLTAPQVPPQPASRHDTLPVRYVS